MRHCSRWRKPAVMLGVEPYHTGDAAYCLAPCTWVWTRRTSPRRARPCMMSDFCAIDFGTSNSAVAISAGGAVQLVELEAGQRTMPTAMFYAVEGLATFEEPTLHFGRAGIAAYVEGAEGRLMRSMKSILGSTLAHQGTDVGGGRSVRYLDVVSAYLRHLRSLAERRAGHAMRRIVLGRPVSFVDDDPLRDRAAQDALEQAARSVGFDDIRFQFEPIAAALDFETSVDREQLVLVADIGGGTSDFSLVRVSPALQLRADRRDDILGNHGIHVAGTDFDRQIELHNILPVAGYRSLGPTGREVPSKVYFDLATWHLINTVYATNRVSELQQMRSFYTDASHHQRLMAVLRQRLGHDLIGRAEAAKIAVAQGQLAAIDLSRLQAGLSRTLVEADAIDAIGDDMERIAQAAAETAIRAQVQPSQVNALYFTGGSTGFGPLTRRIAQIFPTARIVRGDQFASVAQGLGLHAMRVFGQARARRCASRS